MNSKNHSYIVKTVISLWLAVRYVAILFGLFAIGWFTYWVFLRDLFYGSRFDQLVAFFVAWFMLAYVLIPRIHRILTKLYIPDYFIGRSRTIDGILSDPINLAIIGSEKDLITAMESAGWHLADKLNAASIFRTLLLTLARKPYLTQPVSGLYLFNNKQTFAFQKTVSGSPFVRHHIRFWKTPSDWFMSGGGSVDWLAAGTYDKSVGLSYFTLQITHHIDTNTDKERDFILEDLKQSGNVSRIRIIKNYFNPYKHRNGGGDTILTDGSLPVITLRPKK